MVQTVRYILPGFVSAIPILCFVVAVLSSTVNMSLEITRYTSECYDATLNVTVAVGDTVQLGDGACGRLLCDGGARTPRFVKQECELVPDDSCDVKPGKPDADFPHCCEHIRCAGYEVQHAKCVNPETNTVREKGETWALPSGECGYMECKGFYFDRVSKTPIWKFSEYMCGKLPSSRPPCTSVPGPEGSLFPACCPKMVCKGRRRNTRDNDDAGDKE